MKQLQPMDKFLSGVGTAMLNRMDLSPYYGQTYECACGDEHELSVFDRILFQGYWRVAIPCPEDETYLTLIKVKAFTFRRNSSLVYMAGTQVKSDMDAHLLSAVLKALR